MNELPVSLGPTHTKVVIQRRPESLHIVIPAGIGTFEGVRVFFWILFLFIGSTTLIFLYGPWLSNPETIGVVFLAVLVILGVLFLRSVRRSLYASFGLSIYGWWKKGKGTLSDFASRTIMDLEPTSFTIRREILGRTEISQGHTDNINEIEISEDSIAIHLRARRSQATAESILLVRSESEARRELQQEDRRQYTFGSNLSRAEQEWIVAEIGRFLDSHHSPDATVNQSQAAGSISHVSTVAQDHVELEQHEAAAAMVTKELPDSVYSQDCQ